MNILIICFIILTGILFLLLELFLIPGTSIAALVAAGFLLYGVYFAFSSIGMVAGLITLTITAILSVSSVIWFMHSKTLDKVSLKKDIDGSVEQPARRNIRKGNRGETVTRLALMGNAQFGEEIVEVKSADGFMEAGTPVEVTRIQDGQIIVKCVRD